MGPRGTIAIGSMKTTPRRPGTRKKNPDMLFNVIFITVTGKSADYGSDDGLFKDVGLKIHEPSSELENGAKTNRLDPGKDGGNATTQHVLDRGTVPSKSGRGVVPMQTDVDVHVRVRFLLEAEQPLDDIRGQSVGFGDRGGEVVGLFGARDHVGQRRGHEAKSARQVSVL